MGGRIGNDLLECDPFSFAVAFKVAGDQFFGIVESNDRYLQVGEAFDGSLVLDEFVERVRLVSEEARVAPTGKTVDNWHKIIKSSKTRGKRAAEVDVYSKQEPIGTSTGRFGKREPFDVGASAHFASVVARFLRIYKHSGNGALEPFNASMAD